jgi:hypothetical protein
MQSKYLIAVITLITLGISSCDAISPHSPNSASAPPSAALPVNKPPPTPEPPPPPLPKVASAPPLATLPMDAPAPITDKRIGGTRSIPQEGININESAYISKGETGKLKSSDVKQYKVELGADAVIKIPGSGKLKVWIGNPEYNANFPKQTVQTTALIANVGITAIVTPDAPAFKVEPTESFCLRIVPTGSEVSFTLTPKKEEEGLFDVGAYVKLFESNDCSGTPAPKGTTYHKVQVVVDNYKVIKELVKQFVAVFWEKLLSFWGEMLALFFALLLFLIRRRLMKWFGFGDSK